MSPKDETAMENLARYIIRASFSQERIRYLENEGTVVYRAKNGKDQKIFPALEWLAAMCSHIPNRGEQMVRYYGYYSNVSRGKRKEAGADDAIETEGNAKKRGQIYFIFFLGRPCPRDSIRWLIFVSI
ncbi:MAG: transposase, partial [Syntrophaceae bacterium]|nr:transposase [Syntrophaceae bacterium]